MSAETPPSAGHSGDLGWNESDETPLTWLNGTVLVVATGVVWGASWLVSGLPPLSALAGLVCSGRNIVADQVSAYGDTWRSNNV